MTVKNARVLIVDDHAKMRKNLHTVLESERELEIVDEIPLSRLSMHEALSLNPDVVVLGMTHAGRIEIDSINFIKMRNPAVKIVALTLSNEPNYLHAVLDAGADAYVLKDDGRAELVNAIGSVIRGGRYVSLGVTNSTTRTGSENDS